MRSASGVSVTRDWKKLKNGPLVRQMSHRIQKNIGLLLIRELRSHIPDARVEDFGVEHAHIERGGVGNARGWWGLASNLRWAHGVRLFKSLAFTTACVLLSRTPVVSNRKLRRT